MDFYMDQASLFFKLFWLGQIRSNIGAGDYYPKLFLMQPEPLQVIFR